MYKLMGIYGCGKSPTSREPIILRFRPVNDRVPACPRVASYRFARQPLTDAPSNYESVTNTIAGMTLSTILRFFSHRACGGREGKPRGRLTS